MSRMTKAEVNSAVCNDALCLYVCKYRPKLPAAAVEQKTKSTRRPRHIIIYKDGVKFGEYSSITTGARAAGLSQPTVYRYLDDPMGYRGVPGIVWKIVSKEKKCATK